jgi:hypothetical protein
MLPLPSEVICWYGPDAEAIKMANQNGYLYKAALSDNWKNEACASNNIHDCPLTK